MRALILRLGVRRRARGVWPRLSLLALLAMLAVAMLTASSAGSATPVLASGAFTRALHDGWGRAVPGGAWQVSGARFSVAGHRGTAMLAPRARAGRASLTGVHARDVEAQVVISLAAGSRRRRLSAFVQLRQARAGAYRFWVSARAGRFDRVGVSRLVGGRASIIASERLVPAIDVAAGVRLRVRATGAGATALAARAWPAGTAEPTAWLVQADDSTPALTGSGTVGLGLVRPLSSLPAAARFASLDVRSASVHGASSSPPPTLTSSPPAVPPPAVPPPVTTSPPPPDEVLVGAGDIASCTNTRDEQTASLLDGIPGTVFTAGDQAYPDGTAAQYASCYDPSWGRFRARTRPALGDNDYNSGSAAAYFQYFGSAVGDPSQGWYAYDLGAWRVYVLNSNCSYVGGCGPGSPQLAWLQQDLAANPRLCVAAIMHTPRFSSGTNGDTDAMQPFWGTLVGAGAELVLSGHDHDYERFQPLDATGSPDDATGLRQFVVGTGGAGGGAFPSVHRFSVARSADAIGVLELTLHASSYDYRFISIPGRSFSDAGSGTCH